MLRLLDGTNQSNMAIYHLDGTYRITINNFPLSVFGRTDMNRKFLSLIMLTTMIENLLLQKEKAGLRKMQKELKRSNYYFICLEKLYFFV